MITNEIDTVRPQIIDTFEKLRKDYYDLRSRWGVEEGISESRKRESEYYTSTTYLTDRLDNQDNHVGWPEHFYSINLPQLRDKRPEYWKHYVDRAKNFTAVMLGAHTSALALNYPPQGFVSWHTNWNAPSYQILFTWSKTGEGYFRYRDPITHEIVTLQDKVGWNVRYHYFGAKDDPSRVLWHCAYTKCERFSFAYKFVDCSEEYFLSSLEDIRENDKNISMAM
tara:strand:+ start:663 stop:1334 length:672 start_codon:yes stop_codon:yes gene_type:complete